MGIPTPTYDIPDEAETLAKSVKKWGEEKVIPNRREYDEDYENELINPAMKELFVDLGLQKLVWPRDFGGAGMKTSELAFTLVRVLEEVGKFDAGIGHVFSSTLSMFTAITRDPHTDDGLCEEFAPGFADTSELKIGSLILPEQGVLVGGDRGELYGRSVKVKAVAGEDKWVISGEGLHPVNSGAVADIFGVVCSLDQEELAYVMIPADRDGVKRKEQLKKTGLAADKNAEVWFDNVEVPEKYVVWSGDDVKYLSELISWHNLCSCAVTLGSLMDVHNIIKDWTGDRVILYDQPLKDNPLDASVLGDVGREILASRSLTYDLARRLSESERRWEDKIFTVSGAVRIYVLDAALTAIHRVMELMGSAGYSRDWDVEKHWRDIKTLQANTGGSMPVKMDIARQFFGSKPRGVG